MKKRAKFKSPLTPEGWRRARELAARAAATAKPKAKKPRRVVNR